MQQDKGQRSPKREERRTTKKNGFENAKSGGAAISGAAISGAAISGAAISGTTIGESAAAITGQL